MKGFWALPAAIRLAAAAHHAFSVQTDLLAYPQYQIEFSESYIPADDAQARISLQRARDAGDERAATDIATHSPQSFGDSAGDTYEYMTLNDTDYLCTIPFVTPAPEDETPTPESEEEHHQELERASLHGWELLQGMKDNCLYYPGGWWMYSFCFDSEVKQFHPLAPGPGVPPFPPMEDPKVHSYVLGRYGPELRSPPKGLDGEQKPLGGDETKEVSSQLQTRGETNYLVQKLGGGTVCDLTNRERTITVQFHCDPHAREHIHMIKETASCVYLMVVHTPRLCNDVAFRPPEIDQPNRITCQEVVGKQDIKTWTAKKAAQAREALFGGAAEEPKEKQPLVIGGIEVGGHKIVGSLPEDRIETSNIVKPQPPSREPIAEFVATLARSDGRYRSVLSEKEIQRLGLKGKPGDVEDFIESIEAEVNDGVPWRLDVYRTPAGYEFRAIIDERGEGGFQDEGDASKGAIEDGHEEVLFDQTEQGREGQTAKAGQHPGERAQETKEKQKEQVGSEEVLRDEL